MIKGETMVQIDYDRNSKSHSIKIYNMKKSKAKDYPNRYEEKSIQF